MIRVLHILFAITAVLTSASAGNLETMRMDGGNISVAFDQQLHSRIISRMGNKEQILGAFSASEFLSAGGEVRKDR